MVESRFIGDLSEGELTSLVRWFEEDAAMKVFIPIIAGREEDLFEAILRNDDNDLKLKGEIKGIRSILALHDLCMDELERRQNEGAAGATTS